MTDLCSISDVQALTQQVYLGSTTPTSAQVSAWISETSEMIEKSYGIYYSVKTATGEKYNGTGRPFLRLKNMYINTISSMNVDGQALTENTDFWIEDAVAGLIEFKTPPLRRSVGETTGHHSIITTYTYGLATIPSITKQFCAVIVAMKATSAYSIASNPGGSLKSYSDGDVSITYADGTSSTAINSLMGSYFTLMAQLPKNENAVVGAID